MRFVSKTAVFVELEIESHRFQENVLCVRLDVPYPFPRAYLTIGNLICSNGIIHPKQTQRACGR
jgi:hypothetical protein